MTTAAPLPYAVNFWGSKPGTNDDCNTGTDYATLAEARARYDAEVAQGTIDGNDCELWIELDGPDVHEEHQLIRVSPEAKARAEAAYERACRHERAMELGMGLGIDAYNEAMGWD